MTPIVPKRLSAGATIAILALGSPVDPKRLEQGVEALKSKGFLPVVYGEPAKLYSQNDYSKTGTLFSSASAKERAQLFHSALSDSKVSAVFCARGGFGSAEVLPHLDFDKIKSTKKILLGFSDFTAVLNAVSTQTGLVTFHGPMVAEEFAKQAESPVARETVEACLRIISEPSTKPILSGTTLRQGNGSGPLIVGNLTILLSLLGTPWDFSYNGSVLVLEDVHEAPYRIYRSLLQLKLAGKFQKLAGLAFGRFSNAGITAGATIEETLAVSVQELMGDFTFPVLNGVDVGHSGKDGAKNITLPIGCRAEISGNELRVLESAVA